MRRVFDLLEIMGEAEVEIVGVDSNDNYTQLFLGRANEAMLCLCEDYWILEGGVYAFGNHVLIEVELPEEDYEEEEDF